MIRENLWLTADVTPGFISGESSFQDVSLAGWLYDIELIGTGTLQTGVDINILSTGGFEFINGYTFQTGEKYLLHFRSYGGQPSLNNYTNGFDIAQIMPVMKGRLGWRQTKGFTLTPENIQSYSSRSFQSFHSMVTLKNIKNSQEDETITDNEFNDYLQTLQEDAILRALNEVFREPELIEQKLLYTRFGTMDMLIENSGLFVGYIINIANTHDISTQINLATLYFDKDCSFNLYLFQDGIKTPLRTIPVSVTAYERTTVEFDTLVLSYKVGRKYYFGYFQDDLGDARAIREQVDTWATTKCFEAYTITAPKQDVFYFNHNYRMYPALPWGINLEMISFKDHTQKILRKANLFDEVQGLTVAIMVIEQILTSTRSNLTERQVQGLAGQLYSDINQAFPSKELPFTAGFKSRLAGEFKRLKETFYPKQEAVSGSREGEPYGLESSWYKQNLRQITNPPIMIGTK